MKSYLYLSLLPESLIASMLPPDEFGAYMATGTAKQPHGQAMFLQIRRDFQSRDFNLAQADERCVPRPDGRPKHSVAEDPLGGRADNLPYRNIEHIRHCLMELDSKKIKTVDRVAQQSTLCRCVKSGSGFFLGDQKKVVYYPYPGKDDMEGKYHVWWRCANGCELQNMD